MNVKTGCIEYVKGERKNGLLFIEMLEGLLKAHPTARTIGNGNRIGGQGGREESASRAPKRVPSQRADASVDG